MVDLPLPIATSHASAEVQAKATIRVLHGAVASQKEWERAPAGQQRKIIIKDENGRRVALHVIEFE